MARTEEEKERAKKEAEDALRALETDEERQAREAKEAEDAAKPRRGRPPGSTAKPKLSEEALRAGCISLVKFLWAVSNLPARLVGGTLEELTPEEVAEGAAQAEPLVKRYTALAIMLTVIGFPLWIVRMFAAKFKRKEPAKLQVVETAQTQNRRA